MVMITLHHIIAALLTLGVDTAHIERAIGELQALLSDLDEVEVKGRQKVDTLLGCMMALDKIIGEATNGE